MRPNTYKKGLTMLPATMAMIVTPDNASVVAACLEPDFMFEPLSESLGNVLVINHITRPTKWEARGAGENKKGVLVSNVLLPPEDFQEMYAVTDRRINMNKQFVNVELV